ncbi:alpha/beta hydrolase [Hymenobacter elongatus]|uniref:alpha/beta hydrolase n=1 Tax=Hymenobacter elongatus TaxID=877208 RepID=UPI002938D8C4|nr:alpha/beta hydrolase-fold protein [Hymenobacter elongatus]
MSTLRFFLLLLFLGHAAAGFGARIDTVTIMSAAMQKTYRAAVALPASYAKNKKAAYPVLYLLHGAYGHFGDWLAKTPDKRLVHRLADQYNIIIVMPEGETFSFYLDSPVNKDSQFETYITKEVIGQIDNAYRTVRSSKGRVITGLSMGGHGALYLSARHPELFAAAGSMSGALDLSALNRRMSPEELKG